MDRKLLFDRLRQSPFGGKTSAMQVQGVNILLDAFTGWPTRWVAYGLATAFHETGRTMQPVREGFAKSDAAGRAFAKKHYPTKYGKPAGPHGHYYYGRGYVQLTWLRNYERGSGVVGFDLAFAPERALEPEVAATLMRDGMEKGWFTGKKLGDYLGGSKTDYRNARRVINGMDKADMIAGYAHAIEAALRAAGYGKTAEKAKPPAPASKPATRLPEKHQATIKPDAKAAPIPVEIVPDEEGKQPEIKPGSDVVAVPVDDRAWWQKVPILRQVGTAAIAGLGALGTVFTNGLEALLEADWKVVGLLLAFLGILIIAAFAIYWQQTRKPVPTVAPAVKP